MGMFDDEYNKTTRKMADTVMEYASQFVARSYLDEYKKANEDAKGAFVPQSFDEKIYKRISKETRWHTGFFWRKLKKILKILVGIALFLCVAFTLFVLLNGTVRQAVLASF